MTRPRTIISLVIFACSICSVISIGKIISVNQDCRERDSIIPKAPLIPGSQLLDEDILIDAPSIEALQRKYESDLEIEEAIAYFQTNADNCFLDNIRLYLDCSGNAEPFGDYQIGVNLSDNPSSKTTYIVYLKWRKCSSDGSIEEWIE